MVAVRWDLKNYDVFHYGRSVTNGSIEPPIKDMKEFYPFRLVVKGGKLTAFAMGQKIHEQSVSAESDPWLALFADGNLTTGVRNLKIVGKPEIPESLALSAGSDLNGWLGDYYGEPTLGENAAWQKRGEEILGRKRNLEAKPGSIGDFNGNGTQPVMPEAVAGSKTESVLKYARPLAEDSMVSYEFWYDPGQALVSPALDRLAFLLVPDGVQVHSITDGRFNRTGLDPANARSEPASRRGPAKLPLKPKAWNRVGLTLKGDMLALSLNGELIYEQKVEPTNQRDFGLFHYADETEARVRNVTLRGAWPKSLPAELIDRPATAGLK